MSRLRFPNLVVVVVIAICLVAASSGFVSTVSAALGTTTSAGAPSGSRIGTSSLSTSSLSASSFSPASAPVVASAITSGDYHSCALVDAGRIKCWGNGPSALLGAGPTVSSSSVPVDVLTISDATAVAAGGASTCAVVTAGAVKCWGGNYSGQLGDGTRDDQSIAVSVVGLTEAVTQVVVGSAHACALTVSGGVKCWGRNDDRRLGDPTFPIGEVSTTAVSVLGLESGVTSLSAGVNHTCAVVNGGAKCWGRNDYSALGGSSNGELVQVQTLTTGVVAVGAGSVHSCALMTTGIVNCWGAGWGGGGLGRGDAGPDGDPVPGPVVNLTNAVSIDVNLYRSCVVTVLGDVKCWGYNASGSFANGDADNRWYNSPQLATGYPDSTQVASGDGHTCALTSRGKVRCSGSNWNGALGAGNVPDQANGIDVIGIDGTPPPSPMKLMFDPVSTSCGTATAGVSLSGSVNATIDWGDTSSDVVSAARTIEHTYADLAAHEISISGSAGHFSVSTGQPGKNCVTGVSQWGTLGLTSLASAFNGLTKLTSVPTDLPSSVTDVSSMFEGTTSFNQDISNWDTSNVLNMSGMFAWTQSFNQPLASWNVSNVTNMAYMFNNALSFNQPLDTWNTAKVAAFRAIFWGASNFDQALPNWSFASARVAALWQFVGSGGLSRENFSTSLIGWASRSQNSGVMAYLGVEYLDSASDAVANLRSKGWDIRGTGLYVPPTTTTTEPPPTTTTTTEPPPTTTTTTEPPPPTTTTTEPPPTTTTTTEPPPTTTTTTTEPPPTTTTTTTTIPVNPMYAVEFSCGDGSRSTPPSISGLMSSTVSLPGSADPCAAPTGSEFGGWTCIGTLYRAGASYTVTGDSLCTATWTVIPVPPTTVPPTTVPAPEPELAPAPAPEPEPAPEPAPEPEPVTPPVGLDVDPAIDNGAQLAAVSQLLDSDLATDDEVAEAVGSLLDVGVTAEQATALAASPKVLASIDSKQAAKVFNEISVGTLNPAQEAALVSAVSAAPTNVKNAFEGAIDVYGAGFDAYVPVGSVVDVGKRRTLVAAAAATAVAGAAGVAGAGAAGAGGGQGGGGGSAGRSGPPGPGGGSTPGSSALTEAQLGAVAGRLGRGMFKKKRDPNDLDPDGGELMTQTRAPMSKILSRILRETAAISFTIAGGVVVIFTLSGQTRKVAVIALGVAFVLHIVHIALTTKPD